MTDEELMAAPELKEIARALLKAAKALDALMKRSDRTLAFFSGGTIAIIDRGAPFFGQTLENGGNIVASMPHVRGVCWEGGDY